MEITPLVVGLVLVGMFLTGTITANRATSRRRARAAETDSVQKPQSRLIEVLGYSLAAAAIAAAFIYASMR